MRYNVLVDTSVWIQYFNKLNSKPGKSVEGLLREGRVVGTGIVLTELLQGAKIEEELAEFLIPFAGKALQFPLPTS